MKAAYQSSIAALLAAIMVAFGKSELKEIYPKNNGLIN
jgi:hypothetical protein